MYAKEKNRYFRHSRLSEAKFRLIMPYFTQNLPASKLAALSDVSRPTINQRFFKLRTRIAQIHYASSPFSGEVEGDESSFGARRVRGKKGRGARGKTIVFGILERQGKVYTEIVPDASKKPLQAVIRGPVPSRASSTRMAGGATMGWWIWVIRSISASIRNEFARGNRHINGIESFRS